MKKGH